MSASPETRDAEWTARLPEIPAATGILWPSVIFGVLCSIFGLYLIVTPVDKPSPYHTPGAAPLPVPSHTATAQVQVQPGNAKTLRCGFVDSKDTTFALGMEEFAKAVQERSHGEIKVELLPGGLVDGVQMDERTLVEAVRRGQLSIGLSTTSPLTNFNHLLDIFDLPFLFDDPAHADRVLDAPVGQKLLSCLQDKNLLGLSYMEVGFRVFSSSVPLPDFASFSGKKLRVMQSVTFTRFVKAIGGDPVPAPVDKILMMGKEGYIDGADRTYPTYWDFRLYEVHRYITETHHAYSVKMVLINDKLFRSFRKEQQELLLQCAKEASHLQRKKQREADAAVKEMAIKEGIKIYEISPEERKKFVASSTELYDEYRHNQSSEILDAILKLAKDH